jgi:hypothetical protein
LNKVDNCIKAYNKYPFMSLKRSSSFDLSISQPLLKKAKPDGPEIKEELEKSEEPTLQQIQKSHEFLKNFIHVTPVLTSDILNELAGCNLFFKCENLQKTGYFIF